MTEKALQIHKPSGSAFSGIQAFEDAQRMAKALCASSLVPEDYRGPNGSANALIAMEMAQRVGASPLAVMQNLHVIQGRPSWSSAFIIASLNSCGRFSAMRFVVEDLGKKTIEVELWEGQKGNKRKVSKKIEIHDFSCMAWANDNTGERLDGPKVTIEMAVLEGWFTKRDSKWVTMPELMLRYRAAAFFGRLYAPDILMGMHSQDEVEDMPAQVRDVTPPTMVDDVATDEPAALEPVSVDAEVIEPDNLEDTQDRNAIKARLDELGIEYNSRAKTETLGKLLSDATTQADTKEEPPTLAPVEDEVPPPDDEPGADDKPAVKQSTEQVRAPQDLF